MIVWMTDGLADSMPVMSLIGSLTVMSKNGINDCDIGELSGGLPYRGYKRKCYLGEVWRWHPSLVSFHPWVIEIIAT